MQTCPLCGQVVEKPFHLASRVFFLCPACDLVFNERGTLPTPEVEKARYLTHDNRMDDEGYRKFLSAMRDSIFPELNSGDEGLDFGSGTAPLLAKMMEESGFPCRCYDPFFHRDESALEKKYAYIVTTEAAEHFHDPIKEFSLMADLLGPTGVLGVMTQMLDSWDQFANWYYPRDPTHVSFYSRRTFLWIAERFRWKVTFPRPHVVIFRR